jgi:hypothetical protein
MTDLAWALATATDPSIRDPHQAVTLAERAVTSSRAAPLRALDALAVSLAAAGRFEEAANRAREALRSATAAGDQAAAKEIAERLRLFEDRSALGERK